jgi:predicted lipoprotein with Yx(FWY)xxD motif
MSITRSLTAGALTVAAAAALVLPGGAAAQGTSVKVRSSKLGRILVDNHGKTLYLWAHDKGHRSSCNGQCATYWPPLVTSGKPKAGPGTRARLLRTSRRADGRKQVTYHGHPLYHYAGDGHTPGSTKGEGLDTFGGSWYVVDSSGKAVEPASHGEMGGGGNTGYGY